MKKIIIYADGASRGNPGHAAYGVCIHNDKGEIIAEVKQYLGTATNNVAEYKALIRSLEEAKKLGAEDVRIFTDSQLVARQYDGTYRVKDFNLGKLLSEIRKLEKNFKSVTVTHIMRSSHDGNKLADKLANMALDEHLGKNL